MKFLSSKALYIIMTLSILVWSVPPTGLAAGQTVPPVKSPGSTVAVVKKPVIAPSSIGAVTVTGQTYFELEKVEILDSQGEDTNVFLTVSLHNYETQDIFLRDYWIYLLSVGNSQVTMQLAATDQKKNRVLSSSTERFSFYASVNGHLSLKNLKFKFIKWDFTIKGFEQPLGTLSIPQNYSTITPNGKGKRIEAAGLSIRTAINQTQYSRTTKNVQTMVIFQVENSGNSPISFPAYQFYLRTFDGNRFKMISVDETKVNIAPLETKKIMLFVDLPYAVDVSKWTLLVTQYDNDSKLMVPVAQYELLPEYLEQKVNSSDDSQRIEYADNLLDTRITNVFISHNEVGESMLLHFLVENVGSTLVTLPVLSFSIRMKEGLLYPAVNLNKEILSMNPNENEDIIVAVDLPEGIAKEDLQLILNQPLLEGSKSVYPLAKYNIPSIVSNPAQDSQEYNFAVNKKVFNAKLNGMNRYPWGADDVITADIAITSTENITLGIPSFAAYFLLDGKVKINATILNADSAITLKENTASAFLVIGKIPYKVNFSTLQLVLLNTEKDKTLTPLVEFVNISNFMKAPFLATGEKMRITEQGRSSSIQVHNVKTYKNGTKNLLYVEVELENLEKRFVDPPMLVASFKTKDELYFPLKVSVVNQPISPNGKVLIACWALIPKSYALKDLQLMLAQGIKGDVFATEDSIPDALVRAVNFQLPNENSIFTSGLTNIQFNAYNLSMNKVMAALGITPDTMTINFDYKLNKNSEDLYENIISGHKLLLEFVNGSSDIKFSAELSLEEGSSTLLQAGSHAKTLTFTDTGLVEKLKMLDSFTINLYDQFQGSKQLVASKSLRWFQLSE